MKILCMITTVVDTHYHAFAQTHRRYNTKRKATVSNDNEWLRCVKVGSLGSCRTITTMQFIRCMKGVTVMCDIDNQEWRGGYARAAGGTQGISETFLSNLP